jgi:phenylacetic acid degradation operon negative regulatory protein
LPASLSISAERHCHWRIYTVPDSDRQTHDELRKKLIWFGFGPLAPATWVCPHPRLDDVANVAAGLPAARLTLLTTRTTGLPAGRAMTAACWDLDEIVTTYDDFVRWLRARLPGYQVPQLDSRAAFAERIRLIDV